MSISFYFLQINLGILYCIVYLCVSVCVYVFKQIVNTKQYSMFYKTAQFFVLIPQFLLLHPNYSLFPSPHSSKTPFGSCIAFSSPNISSLLSRPIDNIDDPSLNTNRDFCFESHLFLYEHVLLFCFSAFSTNILWLLWWVWSIRNICATQFYFHVLFSKRKKVFGGEGRGKRVCR